MTPKTKRVIKRIKFEAGFHVGMLVGITYQLVNIGVDTVTNYRRNRKLVTELVLDNDLFD